MKKNLFGLLVMLFAFVSCEGDQGPMGPPGEGVYKTSKRFVIEKGDWELIRANEDNPYYMCERSFPELSNDIYNYGATLGYYILNPRQDNEVQIPMNYDYPVEQDPFNEDWYTWQEYYTFDFMPGSIAFYVHYSDFNIDVRPERQEFRVVLLN